MNITSFAIRLYWFLKDLEVMDDIKKDEKEQLMDITLQLISKEKSL